MLVGDVENYTLPTINKGGHSLILKEEVFLSAVQTRFREGLMSVTRRRHDAAALVVLCNFSKFLPTSFRLTALEMSRWGCSETPPEVGTPPCQKTVRVDLRSLETVYRQKLVSQSGTRLSWPISVAREAQMSRCIHVYRALWRGTKAV